MANIDESRLRQWLSKYHNPDVTFRDVLNAVNHYQGLLPFHEYYTFTDGSTMELVNLTGTIPVIYKGNTYNIPICIWLMDTHPKNAPICYVKPTADMSIKPSMFVDQNGKIYLPYLHDWKTHDGTSDLLGLIQVMIVTFGDQPPVFARPKDTDMPYPSNSFMPGGGYMPPYPPTSYPPTSGFGGYPPYPQSSNLPYPSYNPYPTPYPPYTGGGYPGPSPAVGGTGTIKDEHIRESLLTAIEEKLMRRMKELFQQNQAELETLQRTQEELKQGKMKLNTILSRLEKEKSDLDKNITLLKDKEQELDKAIERLSNEEEIDVDDAVTTTAPLYKQLLNAFAEEAALEDAIYYMGEALRCGVIDLDVFLRQVRTLSRKQFMLRALMQKCRQKAGLAV
ncbi:tumor susceptibility gene 101 protein [Tribolium castaneum]|uniref:Tumor susceptibility gene 101 protein-like Protein n=1 Tax=Tribolium castaneum TaxID=7070 RepID=D6WIH5_TRICA|nr:PREDICTED: tumor susceptibility gene 101 protein [Tribolium castaneum]EEZ99668.1 Tumor susceptibility gene 101 protein-like Protein [Tribolium castaneum]|eukprot:XP_972705.1 PREDICTED: tumor susceptibility gene 101 protein [Tribolium castaneum]